MKKSISEKSKPRMFSQRQKSNYLRNHAPLSQIDEDASSLSNTFQPPNQMQIQKYAAMTSRTIKPSKGISRKRISLIDSANQSFSQDSSRTVSRKMARQKSKVLRSYINTNGIKKQDGSVDSKVYQTFEPSFMYEKPISPSHFDAVRNSGGNMQGNTSSLQKYNDNSGSKVKKRRYTSPPSNSKNENTTQFSSPTLTKNWLIN